MKYIGLQRRAADKLPDVGMFVTSFGASFISSLEKNEVLSQFRLF